MPDKKPLKANLTQAGNLDSLAEFEDGDFVDVDDGGTGRTSLTSGEVLIGNGATSVGTLVRANLIAGSNKILINSGPSVAGVVLGENVTLDIVESEIDINNTTGQVPLSRLLAQVPGTVDADFTGGGISGTIPAPDEFGNTIYDAGAEEF